MALQGTLKDFSVVDILQLLGQQGKTGTLGLVADGKEAHITFEAGNVVQARFVKGVQELLIGHMLFTSGTITKNQLELALNEHKRTLKGIGDILAEKHYINYATLRDFLTLQTKEVLFRVLQWKSGAYKFIGGKVQYNPKLIKPMSTDFILMDAVRQIDEWPGLLQTIAPFESVFELLPEGRQALEQIAGETDEDEEELDAEDEIDAAFGEFDGGSDNKAPSKQLNLEEPQRIALSLVNGKRNVHQIIALSKLGQFDACHALDSLLDHEMIAKLSGVQSHAMARVDNLIDDRHGSVKSLISQTLLYFSLLAMVIALILTLRPIIMTDSPYRSESQYGKALATHSVPLDEHLIRHRLRYAVLLYSIERLDYPASVNTLLEEGILSIEDVEMIQESRLYYYSSIDHDAILGTKVQLDSKTSRP